SIGKHSSDRVVATSLASEDGLSLLSPEYYNSEEEDEEEEEEEEEDEDEDDEEDDEDEDEEEEDEDYDAFGFDDGYNMYVSDNSQSATGADGLTQSLRQVTNRDRYDSRTPFPRLCGGVFSGPGQLVCFFASIYTRDTYPDQGAWQAGAARRAACRAEMSQQLRMQAKPRNLTRLNNYQSMVMLGLQSSGLFFAYPSRAITALGSDDSDDDEEEEEAAPRYYFRQHTAPLSHGTASPAPSDAAADHQHRRSGIGNVALVCHVDDGSADAALARRFVLGGASAAAACALNAQVAADAGRAALAHTWTLLGCLVSRDGARLWAAHPPAVTWLRAVAAHYVSLGDVQTLALVSSVLAHAAAEAPAVPVLKSLGKAVREGMEQANLEILKQQEQLSAPGGLGLSLPKPQKAPSPPTDADSSKPFDEAIDVALAEAFGNTPVDATLGRRLAEGIGSTSVRRFSAFLAAYPGSFQMLKPPALTVTKPKPWAPTSDLLRELDSEEIKQSELLMVMTEEPPTNATPISTPIDIAKSQSPEQQQQQQQQRPSSNSNPADTSADNLWHRLRTNVLDRVNTVGGYAPSAAPDPPPPEPADPAKPNRRQWMRPRPPGSDEAPSLAPAPCLDADQAYMRMLRMGSRPRTRMIRHEQPLIDDTETVPDLPNLDAWKLIYARILYKWELDAQAVEVLKCVQHSGIRHLYTQLQCQPTEPQHDNLPRTGITVIGADKRAEPPVSGAPWLSCSWCHEYVHGRAMICHACGHGGHQKHMLRWFRTARRQLMRIGLAPVAHSRFADSSNSSSCSNLGALFTTTKTTVCSPELPPVQPSLDALLIVPELTITSPANEPSEDADANRALLLDMQTTLPLCEQIASRRPSNACAISRESSDSSIADDAMYADQSMLLSSHADDDDDDDDDDDMQVWDSSDVDSDDHLHTHPRLIADRRQSASSPQCLDEQFSMQL
ncbi:hypothetical protein GGI20_005999, partial [Coemansia sp. BCRC 34301]